MRIGHKILEISSVRVYIVLEIPQFSHRIRGCVVSPFLYRLVPPSMDEKSPYINLISFNFVMSACFMYVISFDELALEMAFIVEHTKASYKRFCQTKIIVSLQC